MTRLHCFQHVPFESPGRIAGWAAEHHYPLAVTHLYEEQTPPSVDDYDWLVVMGGPMNANDEAGHPWLTTEMVAIETALGAGKTVVGICLGAQLIARVMGARVYEGPTREIGWFDVTLTSSALDHTMTADLPESFTALHWHDDTFDLPAGAVHLARSEACANQMYAVGGNVVGIQFHLELTEEIVTALADHTAERLVAAPSVQTRDEILAEITRLQGGYDILDSILARL